MLFKTYKSHFLAELSFLNDEEEASSFFYIILEKIHKLKRLDLALQPNLEISEMHLKLWEEILSELKTEKPIQYILGETEFFGLYFQVNEHTLIPRQETEELVEFILSENKNQNNKNLRILDIGTGSGCIAISLAKSIANSSVFAIDVSDEALKMAKINAKQNRAEVGFLKADILKTDDLKKLSDINSGFKIGFDVIVSNPPYVRNLEKHEIKTTVLEFEPHLALFVEDNDALLFYRKISQLAFKNLGENGKLFFEINQYLGKETVAVIENTGFKKVQLIKDIYGNDRMIFASKN